MACSWSMMVMVGSTMLTSGGYNQAGRGGKQGGVFIARLNQGFWPLALWGFHVSFAPATKVTASRGPSLANFGEQEGRPSKCRKSLPSLVTRKFLAEPRRASSNVKNKLTKSEPAGCAQGNSLFVSSLLFRNLLLTRSTCCEAQTRQHMLGLCSLHCPQCTQQT